MVGESAAGGARCRAGGAAQPELA